MKGRASLDLFIESQKIENKSDTNYQATCMLIFESSLGKHKTGFY